MLSRLDRVGLQAVALNAACIGELRHHRHDPRCAHLCRFLNDKIGARFLDRRKAQPQVRGHLQGCALVATFKRAAAFTSLNNLGLPFAITSVE